MHVSGQSTSLDNLQCQWTSGQYSSVLTPAVRRSATTLDCVVPASAYFASPSTTSLTLQLLLSGSAVDANSALLPFEVSPCMEVEQEYTFDGEKGAPDEVEDMDDFPLFCKGAPSVVKFTGKSVVAWAQLGGKCLFGETRQSVQAVLNGDVVECHSPIGNFQQEYSFVSLRTDALNRLMFDTSFDLVPQTMNCVFVDDDDFPTTYIRGSELALPFEGPALVWAHFLHGHDPTKDSSGGEEGTARRLEVKEDTKYVGDGLIGGDVGLMIGICVDGCWALVVLLATSINEVE